MSRARSGKRKPLMHPFTMRKLMRELATTEDTQLEVAARYGVSRESINRFAARHAAAIQELREHSLDEFAGLQIAEKQNRLAMYEQLLDDAVVKGDRMVAVRILRNVAEELGHLPSRMQISGAVDVHTTYTVMGEDGRPVDPKALT